MNKEEALNDFLKGLRVVLSNASAYPKGHPYFKKSVEGFKRKADTLLGFSSPIRIGITPDSLFIDGRYWGKVMLYLDLASMFHLRKIKSIEIRKGLTNEELLDFLSSVSRPIKEILRQGGMQNILNREKATHFSIEELDYSQLLKDEGEESKDIWVYLFRQAVDKQDFQAVNRFADNFKEIIGKFKAKDLLIDDELRQNIYNFLAYLKDKEKDKFNNCSKELLRFVLKGKNISGEDKLDKIKAFFQDLNTDDLSEVLLNGITKEEGFNYFSFQLFSQLIREDTHKEIAPNLEKKIKNTETLQNNPKIRKKIKELFSARPSFISSIYLKALSSLIVDNSLEGGFSLDRELAHKNYYFTLLHLLREEPDKEKLGLISKQLLKECNRIIQEKNLEDLRLLLDMLDNKRKIDPSLTDFFEELQKCTSCFIESAVFEEETAPGLEYFIDGLKRSFLGLGYYFDKIFKEEKVNPYALRLWLKFFPESLTIFYENLEMKHSDIDFLVRIVKSLEKAEHPLSIGILKNIFNFSNNIIKIEILRAMQNLSEYDEEFLFSVLEKEDTLLKKEALVVLVRDEAIRKKTLEKLFSIRSPWGRKNKILIEHIMLIEDTGLKEAKDYLIGFGKRPFFWNKNLRTRASEALKKITC